MRWYRNRGSKMMSRTNGLAKVVSIKWAVLAGCFVAGLIVSAPCNVAAQDAYLARIYGEGVHLYYRNDTTTARCRFDSVINEGSRDPRAYYFRAIMALESGDVGSADSDIRTGARYELEGQGTYDVWSALARVQGPHRLQFECKRNAALLALRKQSVIDRYPLNPRDVPEQLRQPADPYRTDLEPNVPSIRGDDPFLDGDEPPSAPLSLDEPEDDEPADEPMDDFDDTMDDTQPEVEDDEPFMDDAAPEEDPFGDEPMDDVPADDLPVEDDPFSDEAAADDPFAAGDAGADMGDAPADGAGDTPDDDPFADDGGDPFGDIFE